MKRNKYFSILLTLLSSFSCATNARESIRLERDIIKNKEDVILSKKGQKYFEELMKSREIASKKIEDQEIKISNPNAGKNNRLTDIQKFSIVTVPILGGTGVGLLKKVISGSEESSRPDSPNDYKLAADGFFFPITLLSIKSLICILDGLAYGQFKKELDNIYVPLKQTNIMNGAWQEVKWDDYGYSNERFLCAVQRVAIHGNASVDLIESEVKEWMRLNNFDNLSYDDLKKKWNNIHTRYRETIKAVCNSQFNKTDKIAISNFINKLSEGESLNNPAASKVVAKDGIYPLIDEENHGPELSLKKVTL